MCRYSNCLVSEIDNQLRRQVLAEWRGYREPKRKKERCLPASRVVDSVMKKWGLEDRLNQQQVFKAWSGIVGEFISQHARPTALKDGVLVVEVLQPAIHYELDRVWRERIISEFKKHFGRSIVRDVSFRLG